MSTNTAHIQMGKSQPFRIRHYWPQPSTNLIPSILIAHTNAKTRPVCDSIKMSAQCLPALEMKDIRFVYKHILIKSFGPYRLSINFSVYYGPQDSPDHPHGRPRRAAAFARLGDAIYQNWDAHSRVFVFSYVSSGHTKRTKIALLSESNSRDVRHGSSAFDTFHEQARISRTQLTASIAQKHGRGSKQQRRYNRTHDAHEFHRIPRGVKVTQTIPYWAISE